MSTSHLIGIGFDGDGHRRVTKVDGVATMVGGSEETHDRMTETALKTLEELKRRGKNLQSVGRPELAEIIHKVTPQ